MTLQICNSFGETIQVSGDQMTTNGLGVAVRAGNKRTVDDFHYDEEKKAGSIVLALNR